MDEVKKYLQQNREELDSEIPSDAVWEKLECGMYPAVKVVQLKKAGAWIAAATVLLVAGCLYYFLYADSDPVPKQLAGKNDSGGLITKQASPAVKPVDSLVAIVTMPIKKNKIVSSGGGIVAQKKKVYGYEDLEAGYKEIVDIQLASLRKQPIYGRDGNYFAYFREQIRELGDEEKKAKQRIRLEGVQSTGLDELITILQRKLTLLKQLQFEINKMNNRMQQQDASIQHQKPSYINL